MGARVKKRELVQRMKLSVKKRVDKATRIAKLSGNAVKSAAAAKKQSVRAAKAARRLHDHFAFEVQTQKAKVQKALGRFKYVANRVAKEKIRRGKDDIKKAKKRIKRSKKRIKAAKRKLTKSKKVSATVMKQAKKALKVDMKKMGRFGAQDKYKETERAQEKFQSEAKHEFQQRRSLATDSINDSKRVIRHANDAVKKGKYM